MRQRNVVVGTVEFVREKVGGLVKTEDAKVYNHGGVRVLSAVCLGMNKEKRETEPADKWRLRDRPSENPTHQGIPPCLAGAHMGPISRHWLRLMHQFPPAPRLAASGVSWTGTWKGR